MSTMDSEKYKTDLSRVFRTNGYSLPLDESEVESFEANMDKFDDLPVEWDNPLNILTKGRRQTIKSSNVETDQTTVNNLAMAAREGKTISDSVRMKMNNDRKNSTNNEQ